MGDDASIRLVLILRSDGPALVGLIFVSLIFWVFEFGLFGKDTRFE